MAYAQVVLRGVRGAFTWRNAIGACPGDRVVVGFRGKQRLGLVWNLTDEVPPGALQNIEKIIDHAFLPTPCMRVLLWAERFYRTRPEVLARVAVPKAFFEIEHPVPLRNFWQLAADDVKLRGAGQNRVKDLIEESGGIVRDDALRAIVSPAVVRNMAQKGILEVARTEVPDPLEGHKTRPRHVLNVVQQAAVDQISASEQPSLLWGVTGSGKTEVYKSLIETQLHQGKTALFLVPEIGLTPQLMAEMRGAFGAQVGVWHSKMNDGDKRKTIGRIKAGDCRVLVGVRSAVWVGLPDIGIIILDEEHEWTYWSQQSPRYSAHQVAERLAYEHGAKLVFGTATPRVESYYAATEAGTMTLVQLPERINKRPLPTISIIDQRQEWKKDPDSPISQELKQALLDQKSKGQKSILFLNKRGLHQSLLCRTCGHHAACPACDSRVKLHQRGHNKMLICHICGLMRRFAPGCDECHEANSFAKGWGTQGVEEYMKMHMPQLRVRRVDADTTTGKNSLEEHINALRSSDADVLLGTQMITKGLDILGIGLVGVLSADTGLSLPDFRAEERVFQLLTQVAGRAGRHSTPATILIQTHQPEHPIYDFVRNYDTAGFLQSQLQQRQKHDWPPHGAIVKLSISHPDKAEALRRTQALMQFLQQHNTQFDLHWAPAFMPRTHHQFHFHVFARGDADIELHEWLMGLDLPNYAKWDPHPISLL